MYRNETKNQITFASTLCFHNDKHMRSIRSASRASPTARSRVQSFSHIGSDDLYIAWFVAYVRVINQHLESIKVIIRYSVVKTKIATIVLVIPHRYLFLRLFIDHK